MAALFEPDGFVDLPEGRRYILSPDVPEREQKVARALGAKDFGVNELVSFFQARLHELEEGARPNDSRVPRFLREATPETMTRLYEVLIDEELSFEVVVELIREVYFREFTGDFYRGEIHTFDIGPLGGDSRLVSYDG